MTNCTEPVISIGIPTYSRADSLDRLLCMLRAQTYNNLEVIISDDCSQNPQIREVCEIHARCDDRIRYVRQQRNIGLMANQNFTLRVGTGEYVCTLHDDDEIPGDYFERMVKMLEHNKTLSLCGPSCRRYYEGQYWYDYQNFSNVGLGRMDRLKQMICLAFSDPWSFEHLLYGVFRRSALPKNFEYGRWRSISLFFFVCTISGEITTVPEIRMCKHTEKADLEKYEAAKYVQSDPILARFCSDRSLEERLTTFARLIYYVWTSVHLMIFEKIRLTGHIINEYFLSSPPHGPPPTPLKLTGMQEGTNCFRGANPTAVAPPADYSVPIIYREIPIGTISSTYSNSRLYGAFRRSLSLAKRIIRRIPGVRSLNCLRLALWERSRRYRSPLLSLRIYNKWISDCAKLPLTDDHYELYVNIHRLTWTRLGEFPNLVKCRDYNDRIHWLKLFDQAEATVRCCDKLLVRDYIIQRLGDKYMCQIYQVADTFADIDFDKLPNAFVIKVNHDSGTAVLIRDKRSIQPALLKEHMNKALGQAYGLETGEWAYRFVPPKVFVEEYIDVDSIFPPSDFRFHCVNGKVRWLQNDIVCSGYIKEIITDPNGKPMGIHFSSHKRYEESFHKPDEWAKMCEIAEILSSGWKYVRVDLFLSKGRIYAGELTFFPYCGLYKGEGQKKLGQLLDFDRTTFKPPIYHDLMKKSC